jgi:predicted amidohydrolase
LTKKFFESVMVARAIESTVFFAYSNMVGMDSRMDFWGGGALIGPRGNMIAKGPYYEEAVIQGQVDLHSLELARKHRPTIRDTNPVLLKELARNLGFEADGR